MKFTEPAHNKAHRLARPARIETARRLRAAGRTLVEIASELGVSRSTVATYVDVEHRPPAPPVGDTPTSSVLSHIKAPILQSPMVALCGDKIRGHDKFYRHGSHIDDAFIAARMNMLCSRCKAIYDNR